MAAKTLPKTPFQLHGGCFCNAIRYKISVPQLSERKLLPKTPLTLSRLLVPPNEVNERMPIISIDHCHSCRRVPGAIMECWFICPPSWIQFTLQPRDSSPDSKANEDDLIKIESMAYLDEDKNLAGRTWVTHFKSSEHSNRTFCGRCGTHLTFFKSGVGGPMRQAMGMFVDIAAGTLDKESVEMEGFGPVMQAWKDDGIPWAVKLVSEGKEGLLDDTSEDLAKLKVEDEEEK
jgi:hypothetical protein